MSAPTLLARQHLSKPVLYRVRLMADLKPNDMPPRRPLSEQLRRNALGLWFFAIGALGLLRVAARAKRDPDFLADAVMQAWLFGSAFLVVLGLVLVVRGLRGKSSGN